MKARVYVQFTDFTEKIKDFGENIMAAFDHQRQFVRKQNVKTAQVQTY